jgi:tetratricopeptide (TPR) repeat protein
MLLFKNGQIVQMYFIVRIDYRQHYDVNICRGAAYRAPDGPAAAASRPAPPTVPMSERMRMTPRFLLLILSAAIFTACSHEPPSGVTPASTPNAAQALSASASRSADFLQARQLHLEGVEGNARAAKSSRDRLGALLERHPEDALIRAYAGSAELLLARYASAPWTKQRHARQGLGLLDAAVAQAPNHLEVRLVRGLATSHLPDPFGRAAQSRRDIARAARQAREHLQANRPADPAAAAAAAAALYHYGVQLQHDGEVARARALWRQALEIAPDTRGGERARRELAELDP